MLTQSTHGFSHFKGEGDGTKKPKKCPSHSNVDAITKSRGTTGKLKLCSLERALENPGNWKQCPFASIVAVVTGTLCHHSNQGVSHNW